MPIPDAVRLLAENRLARYGAMLTLAHFRLPANPYDELEFSNQIKEGRGVGWDPHRKPLDASRLVENVVSRSRGKDEESLDDLLEIADRFIGTVAFPGENCDPMLATSTNARERNTEALFIERLIYRGLEIVQSRSTSPSTEVMSDKTCDLMAEIVVASAISEAAQEYLTYSMYAARTEDRPFRLTWRQIGSAAKKTSDAARIWYDAHMSRRRGPHSPFIHGENE